MRDADTDVYILPYLTINSMNCYNTSDIPPLSDEFFSKAKLRMPISSEATVAVTIDSETLEWFQSQGEKAQNHMAAALRIYAETQKYCQV